MLKKSLIIGAMVVPMLATAACSSKKGNSGGSAGGDYKVGIVLDQTGVSSQIATPTGAGAQAYIKQVNDAGGISGRKIKITTVVDSKSNAAGAQAAFQNVLQTQPIAVIGSVNSLGIGAAVPIMSGADTPVLIGSAPDTFLVPPRPWLFTQVMPAASMIDVSLSYIDKALGGLQGKRVAVSAVASAFGDGYVKAAHDDASKRGYQVVLEDRPALTMTSFATNAAKVVDSKADALLLLDVPSQTPLVVKDLQAAGYKNPIIGYESASDPAILQSVATDQYVSFRGAPVPAADGDLAKAASAAGVSDQAKSLWFSYGWNEAAVLVQALKSCGASCTGKSLIDSLQNVQGFTPPDGSSFGSVSYSATKHYATSTAQFYSWDVDKKAEKPLLDPLNVP
jgi:ABC-type branched-subunit amino acid transport system substrate-binding protein